MKKFFVFCLMMGLIAYVSEVKSQIVNIPDPIFKAKLIAQGVDLNNDGEIQISEAQAVDTLGVQLSNISDLTGIDAFTNLIYLACDNNQLTNLDVSANTALQALFCQFNQLTSLDVSANTALSYLNCSNNQLTSLDVSANTALSYLHCFNNQLTNLDVSVSAGLTYLYCNNNQLTSLDVSANAGLTHLSCENNQLTSLDVSANTALLLLRCENNQLTSLDVSASATLNHLWCYNNQFTSLNISSNTVLITLLCGNNQLTSLDVSANTALQTLNCPYNQLTSLDVSANNALQTLNCQYNQLTSLDVSANTTLSYLNCYYNQLTNLLIKNGRMEQLFFNNNPNLNYICADYSQISAIQDSVQQFGLSNVFISTLCSYTPGGAYNTISGISQVDIDLNGCTATDPNYPFFPLLINTSTNSGLTIGNQQGAYFAYMDIGSVSITPQIANPNYFSATPYTTTFSSLSNTQTHDFCITSAGIFPDVEITLIPLNPARPGFDSDYKIQYKNIGTTIANGDITCDFPGSKMSYVSASSAPNNQTASQLTWTYSNLQPFEVRTIDFTMNVLPPPTNNINDIITTVANISLTNDFNPSDNISTLNETLVGAYDPNDKTCLEGNLLNNDKIGEYLHYMIRFQNTGNYPAENVVVIDTLDGSKYDLGSLQIVETSHNGYIDLKSNILQFYFENIQLPDSFSNEPESHGFVVFKIKTQSNLPQNSSVSNKAEIYFDFNPPIVTNVETTTFSNLVGIQNPAEKPHFQYYPNPAHNLLTIESPQKSHFQIINTLGEIVKETEGIGKINIDLTPLPQGVYFISSQGIYLRFIKF